MRGIGRHDHRAQPAGSAAQRGRRRHRRLADAPLAGVEDRSRRHGRASPASRTGARNRPPGRCRLTSTVSVPLIAASVAGEIGAGHRHPVGARGLQRRHGEAVDAVAEARRWWRTTVELPRLITIPTCEYFDSRKRSVKG